MIIGIAGKAGAGKDTFASFLEGYTVLHFARPLKEATRAAFGLDPAQLEGRAKEVVDERYGLSPRQMLQQVGTDLFRKHFGEDFWIRRLMAEIDTKPNLDYAVADVRFENEADAIKDRGGFIVYVYRTNLPEVPGHVSEQFDPAWADVRVENNGRLQDLQKQAENYERYFRHIARERGDMNKVG